MPVTSPQLLTRSPVPGDPAATRSGTPPFGMASSVASVIAVMAKVSQAIHHFQILRTIIGPVPVDVMDDLSVEQPATEDALHDDAMHISLSFSVHHGAVSVGHCPFTPLPFWVAFACESSIAEGKVPACHGAEVSILAGRRLAA